MGIVRGRLFAVIFIIFGRLRGIGIAVIVTFRDTHNKSLKKGKEKFRVLGDKEVMRKLGIDKILTLRLLYVGLCKYPLPIYFSQQASSEH